MAPRLTALKWLLIISIKILFHLAAEFPFGDKVFYQPVFQRMVGHDHQPPARNQHLGRLDQKIFQRLQLLVHLDAQGLENLRQVFIFFSARDETANGIFQIGNRNDRCIQPRGNNSSRQ